MDVPEDFTTVISGWQTWEWFFPFILYDLLSQLIVHKAYELYLWSEEKMRGILRGLLSVQRHLAPCSQQTLCGHSPQTKPKGRVGSSGEKERSVFQWRGHREDSGLTSQEWSPKCQEWFQIDRGEMQSKDQHVRKTSQVKVKLIVVLGSVTWGSVLLASGQPLLLAGVALVPITGCFACYFLTRVKR